MPVNERVSRTDGASILVRSIDREHCFAVDTREFVLHSRQNELVA
jgi:hypothetical protein